MIKKLVNILKKLKKPFLSSTESETYKQWVDSKVLSGSKYNTKDST